MGNLEAKNNEILSKLKEYKLEFKEYLSLIYSPDLKYIVGQDNYKLAQFEIDQKIKPSETNSNDTILSALETYFMSKIGEIDFNKILLMAALHASRFLEDPKLIGNLPEYRSKSSEEIEDYQSFLAAIIVYISREIDKKVEPIISATDESTQQRIRMRFNVQSLLSTRKRILNYKYYSQDEFNKIKQGLISGEIIINDIINEEEELYNILGKPKSEEPTSNNSKKGKKGKKNNNYVKCASNNIINAYLLLMIGRITDEEFSNSFNGLNLNKEDIIQLYNDNKLDIKALVRILKTLKLPLDLYLLVKAKKIKPHDLAKLYEDEELSLDDFKQIIENPEISMEEKVLLIYSVFDKENDNEARKYLISHLKIQQASKDKDNGHITTIDDGQKDDAEKIPLPQEKNRYVYDPFYKWKLLGLMDPDYTYQLLDDGSVIFEFPNATLNESDKKEKGIVFVERLFKKTSNKSQIYLINTATRYMTSSQWKKIRDKAIEKRNDKITVNYRKIDLSNIIYHSINWGERVCKIFGVKVNPRYSEKDRDEIYKTIEQLKTSRTQVVP